MMAHYHCTWHYLHWGLPWAYFQRMDIDAPGYESNSDKKKGNTTPLGETEEELDAYAKRLDQDS